MQMGKVFYSEGGPAAPSIATGWYYQIDLRDPKGPFETKVQAASAARAEHADLTDKPSGVFQFLVPVCVTVEEGRVTEVHVADETTPSLENSELIEGDPQEVDLQALVDAANDDEDWPAWEFGW